MDKYADLTEREDILEILLDENNKEPIYLVDEQGCKLRFKQIAVIPYELDGETSLFAILAPLDKLEGVGEDEALVFRYYEENGGILKVETDTALAEAIFDEYYLMLEKL
ncbi:MAG: hypothetical protein NC132_06865 [Corallococcus sp.]|nr:hypothetical protein [Corallococcus sp.]